MDWVIHLSVRICSSHLQLSEPHFLKWKYYPGSSQSPPKHKMASSTTDCPVKLWNTETYDQFLKIDINKEICMSIAFHPFKQMCACSFTDGHLRFFDLMDANNMGRCMMYKNDIVIDMIFFPNGTHLLTATKGGVLDLIAFEKFEPLSVKIYTVFNTQIPLASIKISMIEPYSKIALCSEKGKISVMTRKKLASINYENFAIDENPKYAFLDTFNLTSYEESGFKEKSGRTLDDYYSQEDKPILNLDPRKVLGDFSHTESGIILCIEYGGTYLYIRNYTLHQVLRKLTFASPVYILNVSMIKPRVLVGMENCKIKIQDFCDSTEKEQVECQMECCDEFQGTTFCSHNMIATIAGSEIIMYSIQN